MIITYENIDEATGLPTGTLRIPAFLMHNYRYVDSRSILKNSCDYVRAELLSLIKEHGLPGMPHVKADDVVDIIFTSATELEFWVKTPSRTVTKKNYPYLKNYKNNTGNVHMVQFVLH